MAKVSTLTAAGFTLSGGTTRSGEVLTFPAPTGSNSAEARSTDLYDSTASACTVRIDRPLDGSFQVESTPLAFYGPARDTYVRIVTANATDSWWVAYKASKFGAVTKTVFAADRAAPLFLRLRETAGSLIAEKYAGGAWVTVHTVPTPSWAAASTEVVMQAGSYAAASPPTAGSSMQISSINVDPGAAPPVVTGPSIGQTTKASSGAASTSLIAAGVPADAQAGDLLLALVGQERTGLPVLSGLPVTTDRAMEGTEGSGQTHTVARKRLAADDLTGSVTASVSGSAHRQAMILATFRGSADPVLTPGPATLNGDATSTFDMPTVTAAVGQVVVYLLTGWTTVAPFEGRTFTAPAGWTLTQTTAAKTDGGDSFAVLAARKATAAGPMPLTITESGVKSHWIATGVLLAAGSSNPPPSLEVTVAGPLPHLWPDPVALTLTATDAGELSTVITTKPAGSTAAAVSGATTAAPKLLPDKTGTYELTPTATGPGGSVSRPTIVKVTSQLWVKTAAGYAPVRIWLCTSVDTPPPPNPDPGVSSEHITAYLTPSTGIANG